MAELLQFKAAGNGKKEDGRRDRFRFTKCPAKRAGNAFCWIFHVSRPCLPPARTRRRAGKGVSLFLGKFYGQKRMIYGRKKAVRDIFCSDRQAGCVYTGMAANMIGSQHIPVDQQLDPVLLVVHKAENADRAWGDIQKFFHKFRSGKGQTGRLDLFGEQRGAEFLRAGHHQKIEFRLLRVAEKEIFADLNPQDAVHVLTGLNGVDRSVVYAAVRDLQTV